jgi:hypothetical protein
VIRIASYNVENLFARPKALNGVDWADGRPILDAFEKVNALMAKAEYTAAVKQQLMSIGGMTTVFAA